MEEYLDVIDENGVPTGKTVERSVAHREGFPHRTSHLWLVRRRNGRIQVLLQKRAMTKSFPGCYDISSAGHIPAGQDFCPSAIRELQEELGVNVDVICKIGVVSDYYNLIRRHNINHYFLCRIVSFGEKHLTKEEKESFHLSTLKLKYDDALDEYDRCSRTRLGKLIANREVSVLKRAKELLDETAPNLSTHI